MAKDPAFLMYSKDWLEGTAGLLPAEKGVYIDLMCHQHQKKFLPGDTARLARLAGMSEIDFLLIWVHIQEKFVEVEPGKLMNKRLKIEMEERKNKAHKNRIIGQFAALIRQANLSTAEKEQIKKSFKIDDFVPLTTELSTERLAEWWGNRLKSIATANANGDNLLEGGSGETKTDLLLPSMVNTWKHHFPKGFVNGQTDLEELLEISKKMKEWMNLNGDVVIEENSEKIKTRWGEMVGFLAKDSFLKNYSLMQVNKHFSSVIQNFNNGHSKINGTARKDHTHRAIITGDATGAGSL